MQDITNFDCLLPDTKKLLLEIIESCTFLDQFVLVGGSALALHLNHRKSEDLDFFTYADNFDKRAIFEYISRFEQQEILNQTDNQVDLLINGIKVTFFNAKWAFLKPHKIQKFNLATIQNIAAMKVNALLLRAKYRDYYDLYHLLKNNMEIKELYEQAEKTIKGITFKLFAVALIYIDDIEDDNIKHLEPSENISKKQIRYYFQQKLKKYKN